MCGCQSDILDFEPGNYGTYSVGIISAGRKERKEINRVRIFKIVNMLGTGCRIFEVHM